MLVLDGIALLSKVQVRSLGMQLDPEGFLDPQPKEKFFQLSLPTVPLMEDWRSCYGYVMCAFISYNLDNFNIVYFGLPLKTVWKLELVQNEATRLLIDW